MVHCEMFRATFLAMFWRCCGGTKLQEKFQSVTYVVTTKIVARQVARKVQLNPTFRLLQPVSQQFWRLQNMLHFEIFLATLSRRNVAKTLRDKLPGTFHSVSRCLKTNLLTRLCTCSELVVGGRDFLKIS